MNWSDYSYGDRIIVVKDHKRGGRMLASKGMTGEVRGHDHSMFESSVREAWVTVRIDGKKRNRNLPASDIRKVIE